MKLIIKWQRLTEGRGETCERCALTEKELGKAVEKLGKALSPKGIEVVLEKSAIPPGVFKNAPLESNRIWIDDKALEDWLHGETGRSACCGPCGDSQCRTIQIGGAVHESIPEPFILKAGLLAAERMLKNALKEEV